MKQLVLMRHGKSGWDEPIPDRDRELTRRGRSDAQLVAEEAKAFLCDGFTMWSSNAERAASTAIIAGYVWGVAPDSISFRDELYTFEKRSLADAIRRCDESIANLVIFGHNPAITDFINSYGDQHVDNVPTAGLICIEFEGSWSSLQIGHTTKMLFPKHIRP